MSKRTAGTIFFTLTVIAAVFSAVSIWIIDNPVFFGIGIICFILFAIITLCIDKKYKAVVAKLLDLF